MKRTSGIGCALAVVVLGACGGSDTGGGGGGACTPSEAATMTLAPSGVAPKAVCVLPGGTVTFVNQDTVQHEIAGDGACTALNVGVIAPSASRVLTLADAQTCTFRDAGNPSNTAFQGTVAVSAAPTEGPGY